MSELSRQVANNEHEGITISELETVDLTNCDREPIHIPGAIQPMAGLLLVLTEPDLHIAQVSQNSREIVGLAPEELLDRPLENFIDSQQIAAIHGCVDRNFENINPLPLTFATGDASRQSFNGIVHRAPSGEIVLELEPFDANAKQDFFQFYRQIKDTLTKIQTTDTLDQLCNLIVREIKQITGFDRVMVYRFDDQGNGSVIAEAKKANLDPFLGLHYPATDIPKQARQLYLLNWLRLIPDVGYQPSQLLTADKSDDPEDSGQTRSLLDMSYCVWRSVDPIHIEYLHNMGVSATMVISLMQHQKLWGLVACHHKSPKFVPYEIRTICELLGQLMSTEIATKEAKENLDYKLQLKDIQGQLADRLTGAMDLAAELTAEPELLLKLTGANGAAVCEGNDITLVGQTPDKAQVKSLLSWLHDHLERDLLVTDTLSKLYTDSVAYKKLASGLLAVAISKIQESYVLWFRPELVHTVTWAGNPDVPKQVEEDGSLTDTFLLTNANKHISRDILSTKAYQPMREGKYLAHHLDLDSFSIRWL